jgi:hypothetical protein
VDKTKWNLLPGNRFPAPASTLPGVYSIYRLAVTDYRFQTVHIRDIHTAAIDFDDFFVLQVCKQSAHGFDSEAEIVGNILPGHGEIEFGGFPVALRHSF